MRTCIFVDALWAPGPRNRNDVRTLMQKPGEGQLRRRQALRTCDLNQGREAIAIRVQIATRVARVIAAKVVLGKLTDLPG